MELTKHQINAALSATSKDETRYNLTFVRVEADRLVATDGHRLAIVPASKADDDREPYYLHHKGLKEIVKRMGARDTACVTVEHDERLGLRVARFDVGAGTIGTVPMNVSPDFTEVGEYPNYMQVLPGDSAPFLEVGFNADYLRELAAAIDKANPNRSDRATCVRLQFRGNTAEDAAQSCVRIVGPESEGAPVEFALMPMRIK